MGQNQEGVCVKSVALGRSRTVPLGVKVHDVFHDEQDVVTPIDLPSLARRLYDARLRAKLIQPAGAGIGDWSPRQGECYANCDIWVIRSPEYRVVRGWVVFD